MFLKSKGRLVSARVVITVICLLLLYRGFVSYKRHMIFAGKGESAGAAQIQDIGFNEAKYHVGGYVRVRGKIVSTYKSSKVVFLNFNKIYRQSLSLVIFKSDFGKFSESPEIMYNGKKVIVEGVIKDYKGRLEIIVKSPGQITIIPE